MTTLANPKKLLAKKASRAKRVKATIHNPRNPKPSLIVFKSNKYTVVQLFDPISGKILASSSDMAMKTKGTKVEKSKKVGEDIATKAKNLKITEVVFDRNGYMYHGRVQAVAEGAREGGLKF